VTNESPTPSPEVVVEDQASEPVEERVEVRQAQPAPAGDGLVNDLVAAHRAQPFVSEDAADQVALLTRAATSLMVKAGFQARVMVTPGEYHQVKMVVDDRSAGVLIGRQGSTVDAVEHLVERIATRTVGERVKLNLDINNYRLRREDGLLGQTRRAIMDARDSGKPVAMEPAGGRERRIVHLEVAEDEDLVTYTEQGEYGKFVVICRPEQVPDEHRDPEAHGPAPAASVSEDPAPADPTPAPEVDASSEEPSEEPRIDA
jgi:spoIIIJ-associated protein